MRCFEVRIDGSAMQPGVNVAAIVADYEGKPTKFGEVYLYDDGSATVYDDFWGGPERYFDSHHKAVTYVSTRIVERCALVW